MQIERFPAARAVTAILWLILTAGVVGAAWLYWRQPARRIDERATLTLLRSQPMSFLVTRRVVCQIVVEAEESTWLGQWRGVLWATVHIHYGVDMRKVTSADIRRQADLVVVTLPEAELLDFAVEPGSVGFMSKSTAAAKLEDLLRDGQRQELERRLRDRAMNFARDHDLMPPRTDLVAELNEAAAAIQEATGVKLRFE